MWMIVNKEIKELLRDRKTLIFMIALPLLLFPLIFGVIAFFTNQAIKDTESKVLNFALIGGEYSTEISTEFKNEPLFNLVEISGDDYKTQINAGELDFVVEIEAGFGSDVLNSGQNRVHLYLNNSELNNVKTRIGKILDKHSQQQQADAFGTLNLNDEQQKALLEPIVLEEHDVADKRESIGSKIGGFIPYIIFLVCLQGAMFPATDLGAGEKERGTLETLLISPTERTNIVLGKFITVALAGIVASMLTVSSMAIWGIVLNQYMPIEFITELVGRIGILDFLLMFLMLIPIAAIFSAVLLTLSIYAKSFKEAQSYMGSLVFVVIVPVILATLPGVKLEGVWGWVPLTNVALAIKELIKGTMDYVALFGIFTSSSVIAAGLIAFCVYWFKQERVLFR